MKPVAALKIGIGAPPRLWADSREPGLCGSFDVESRFGTGKSQLGYAQERESNQKRRWPQIRVHVVLSKGNRTAIARPALSTNNPVSPGQFEVTRLPGSLGNENWSRILSKLEI